MAELHRYPLRVQQSKLDGWWFIFVDEVPGLGVLGSDYEDSLERLKVMARKLFLERGNAVSNVEIVRSDKPTLQVFH
jgi:predicted RNase H-like HicB family nuclease